MKHVDRTQFAQNLDSYLMSAVKFNEMTAVSTPEGNAVLLSEDEYDALMETVFVLRTEESRNALREAAAESIEEAIAEEDVGWN